MQEEALSGIMDDRGRVCSSVQGMREMTWSKGIILNVDKKVRELNILWLDN